MTISEAGARPCSALPRAVCLLAVALGTVVVVPAADPGWRIAEPDYTWEFPRDHWAHEGYRTEWWYFTGHLTAKDDPSRRFGYQFTLFRVGVLPVRPDLDSDWATGDVVMGHAAIGDLARGEHRFSDVLRRATPLLGGFPPFPEEPLAWVLAPAGTPERWSLTWNGRGFDFEMADDATRLGFRLSTRAVKPRILQGPGGYSRKGEGPTAASHYYSFTRLETIGTVTLDGTSWEVRGTSWMDQEFGSSQLSENQVGWDWFSLQLDDGREIMLYVMRRTDGGVDLRNGTLVSAGGAARHLDPEAWSVRSIATWTSGRSGASYPARWTVRVPDEGIFLDVVPEMADQENRGRVVEGLHYWEGAVTVRDANGRRVGRGYVELTGYGEGSRPPV